MSVLKIRGADGKFYSIQTIRGPQGMQGPMGPKGDPFTIHKVYSSIDEMHLNHATDGVPEGGLVVINKNDVDHEDNAKLFLKTPTEYSYLTDLSGAQGIQGPNGKSAYQQALEAGYIGEEADFLELLKGNHDVPVDKVTGVLPLSKGGTGRAMTRTANAIVRFSSSSDYFSTVATKNGAMFATSTNGSPQFGTLPIAQGGTGATDVENVLINLGLQNVVKYTENTGVTIAEASKATYSIFPPNADDNAGRSDAFAYFPEGIIMGGTAASAGLMARGICGITTPDITTGACSKDRLYINYDGDNTYRANRQLILQSGDDGTHYGNNLYQYAAARGDAVKGYCDATYLPLIGGSLTGKLSFNMANPHIHMKDTGYSTDWYFQAYQDQLAFGPTFASAVKTDKTGNMTVPGSINAGSVNASVFKSDTSAAAIKPSNSNEINFGSNEAYLYFGYENRVGSAGVIDTYKFGTHSGAAGATNGNIECGALIAGRYIKGNTVIVGNAVTLNYDSTNECLNFVFG